ncbi:hypothetical protein D3C72_2236900 [compost metagenome]
MNSLIDDYLFKAGDKLRKIPSVVLALRVKWSDIARRKQPSVQLEISAEHLFGLLGA